MGYDPIFDEPRSWTYLGKTYPDPFKKYRGPRRRSGCAWPPTPKNLRADECLTDLWRWTHAILERHKDEK